MFSSTFVIGIKGKNGQQTITIVSNNASQASLDGTSMILSNDKLDQTSLILSNGQLDVSGQYTTLKL